MLKYDAIYDISDASVFRYQKTVPSLWNPTDAPDTEADRKLAVYTKWGCKLQWGVNYNDSNGAILCVPSIQAIPRIINTAIPR
jgi:hypothetical protein